MDEQQQVEQSQDTTAFDAGAGSTEAQSSAASDGSSAAGAGTESLPADASQSFAGSSDMAAKQQEENEKSVKDIYGTVKNLAKGKGGGIDSLKDAYGEGKDAVKAFQNGDIGQGVSDGLKAAGDLASNLPGVGKAIGTGVKLGAQVADFGDKTAANTAGTQDLIKGIGLQNADGSATNYTDAARNLGDKAGAGVTKLTGSDTAGKVAAVATKIGVAPVTAAALIGSSIGGGINTGIGWLKNKYNSLVNP